MGHVPRTHQPQEGLSRKNESQRNVGTGIQLSGGCGEGYSGRPLGDRTRGSLKGGETLRSFESFGKNEDSRKVALQNDVEARVNLQINERG